METWASFVIMGAMIAWEVRPGVGGVLQVVGLEWLGHPVTNWLVSGLNSSPIFID